MVITKGKIFYIEMITLTQDAIIVGRKSTCHKKGCLNENTKAIIQISLFISHTNHILRRL